MVRHLLVTNDFPPKVGGIQSYLHELWRRLDPDDVAVYTTPHRDAASFDAAQPFPIERSEFGVLLPHRRLIRTINDVARRHRAELVVLDPVLPLGVIGPKLELPYAVIVHGAEVTVPSAAPLIKSTMARVLRGAVLVIAGGSFPAAEAERIAGCPLPICEIPPGVDIERFVVPAASNQASTRARYGVERDARLVVSLSRLVPRKGMDVVIEASARLMHEFPDLEVLIGGRGRDEARLKRLVETTRAPVRFVGRVADEELADFYGMADLYAMCCRNRWLGLEQEGFGIVFLEAAACGVPQIAGRSGGSADAVAQGVSGLIVNDPRSVGEVTTSLRRLLSDDELRHEMGSAARRRAVTDFSYDGLAARLAEALEAVATGSR